MLKYLKSFLINIDGWGCDFKKEINLNTITD